MTDPRSPFCVRFFCVRFERAGGRVAVTAILLLALGISGCGGQSGAASDAEINPVLAGAGDVTRGEDLYANNCAACHGVDTDGTAQGPSFLNEVYVPSHHADGAFLVAVRNGVMPHHWDFGPMPAVPGLSDQEVADIVAWVRQQQRDAGVIE